jgi:hypothetical protein
VVEYPSNFDENYHLCIIGHFTVEKYKHLKWPIITFLRDPVDRIISYYSVWRSYNINKNKNIFWFASHFKNQMSFMTRNNLSQFRFVGITERHKDSMAIIEKVLGFKIKNKEVHSNKTPARKKMEFSGRTRRILESMNEKDRVLYNEALRRFDTMAQKYL